MRDRKTLRELVIEAVGRATRSRGAGAAGATMGEILKEAKPETGYVEDYRRVVVRETSSVRVCSRCAAVFSERAIYRGDSYSLVLPYFDEPGACEPGDERYFDLDVLGSAGIERRHGWFNPATRRVTQVG